MFEWTVPVGRSERSRTAGSRVMVPIG